MHAYARPGYSICGINIWINNWEGSVGKLGDMVELIRMGGEENEWREGMHRYTVIKKNHTLTYRHMDITHNYKIYLINIYRHKNTLHNTGA